jgi:hypothetical protein
LRVQYFSNNNSFFLVLIKCDKFSKLGACNCYKIDSVIKNIFVSVQLTTFRDLRRQPGPVGQRASCLSYGTTVQISERKMKKVHFYFLIDFQIAISFVVHQSISFSIILTFPFLSWPRNNWLESVSRFNCSVRD